MGEYKEVEGDLLEMFEKGEFDIIAHGCNCFKTMGAGIARQIAEQFPAAALVDRADSRDKISRLGDFTYSFLQKEEKTYVIFNLYTQFYMGKNLDMEALKLCLRKLAHLLDYRPYRIGLPQIGCGIAGGDWTEVKEVIKKELKDSDVTVVIYKKSERKQK